MINPARLYGRLSMIERERIAGFVGKPKVSNLKCVNWERGKKEKELVLHQISVGLGERVIQTI